MLLHLLGTVYLKQLALHPLVLEELHAVLLIEVDQLDLLVLLLNIIIVAHLVISSGSGFIIIYFKLGALKINCLICTVGQIHRLQTEIEGFH